MVNIGKCPKCENTVRGARVERIDINQHFSPTWVGVSLVCEHCDCVLGVAIDPVALKTDIVNEVVKRLGSSR